jgi:two-component system sensor histidine kinase KdpD
VHVPRWRQSLKGLGVGVGLVGLGVALLLPLRDDLDAAAVTAAMMLSVVGAALAGGPIAAVLTAVLAGVALNLTFLEPYGTLKIDAVEEGIGLAAFVAVALVVGVLVSSLEESRRALQRRNDELAELLDERGRLREQASRAQDLARLDDQRTALLRSVSHDLRTPLSAIRAIAGDIRDGVAYDDDTRRELLGVVVDEADRLERMVANLLSMSRIEAGMHEPVTAALDVADLVAERVRGLSGVLGPFDVHVRVPDDLPLVAGDEIQLEEVLTNLLANAARHSPKGSDLWIVASARDGMVVIEISDRGPGIPVAERERVFLPFERGEGSRSSGMGLAICKSVVEAHGGHMWITDRWGGGATVAFTVPIINIPDEDQGTA